MMSEFKMSDLGFLSYFLGIEFKTTQYGIVMHQSKYAKDLLKKFNMLKCNTTTALAKARFSLEKNGGEFVKNYKIKGNNYNQNEANMEEERKF